MVALVNRDYVSHAPRAIAARLMSYGLFEGRPVTTRGRFVNALVRRSIERLAAVERDETVDAPVYIAGLGRSGTTALGRVLSVHPEVGFLNEPKLIWNVIHSGEDVIGSYSRSDARYRLCREDASPDVVRRARRIFAGYLQAVGRTRLVDKYPELVFRTPFLRAIFPSARLLFLWRSPEDAIGSIVEWSCRYGQERHGERHDWWGVDDRKWRLFCRDVVRQDEALACVRPHLDALERPEDRAGLEWIAAMRAAVRDIHANPDSGRLVRYEAWAAEPARETARILRFAGLGADRGTLRFAAATVKPSASREPATLHPVIRDLVGETTRALEHVEKTACA